MFGERFDQVSRAFAQGLPRRNMLSGLIFFRTTAPTIAAVAVAQPSLASETIKARKQAAVCQAKQTRECQDIALARLKSALKKCNGICNITENSDLLRQIQACHQCYDKAATGFRNAILACHAQICGVGALCNVGVDSTGASLRNTYCCPMGYNPVRVSRHGPVVCGPNCGGLDCPFPYMLEDKICVCACNPASECPSGQIRDLHSCECKNV